MATSKSYSGERVIPNKIKTEHEYLIYLQHQFAYEFAKKNLLINYSVLDMGSGSGYGTDYLSDQVGRIIGLDTDCEAVKHASKTYKKSNLEYKVYDGNDIPYRENTFDAIVSFQVIEHVADDKNFISEIFRVLKPGGIFILTTPNRKIRLKPGQKPYNKFHLREYDQKDLLNVLKNKFRNCNIQGIQAQEEIMKIELDRIKKNQLMIKLDPLNLRQLIPESSKPKVIKLIRKILGQANEVNSNFIFKYSINDFYIISSNIDSSLDLIAICNK